MKTGILYFTTCFHGFGMLRHVDPFVRMQHILAEQLHVNVYPVLPSITLLSAMYFIQF